MLAKAIASLLIGVIVGTYTERKEKSFWGGIFTVVGLTLIVCTIIDFI